MGQNTRNKIRPDQEKPQSGGLHPWAVGTPRFASPGKTSQWCELCQWWRGYLLHWRGYLLRWRAYFTGGRTYFVGGATYFVDADLGLHILEPLLEDGDECGRWH